MPFQSCLYNVHSAASTSALSSADAGIQPPFQNAVPCQCYASKVDSMIRERKLFMPLHHEGFAASALLLCHWLVLRCRNSGRVVHLLMLGLVKTNLWFNLSSTQSISLPIILNSALLSISTLTPSCSTSSSNMPGFSTYSRWYASPLHPRFRTPTLISFGSG